MKKVNYKKPQKPVKIVDYTRKGKKVSYMYLHLTKWQIFKMKVRKFFKRLFLLTLLGLIVVGIFKAGAFFSPKTIYTRQEVIKEVPAKPALLTKIAECESGNRHFGSNGQVLVRANVGKTHNSVDIGKYQINSLYHGKRATELGLNLWVEADNEKYAEILFNEKGSEPWSASKLCWSK